MLYFIILQFLQTFANVDLTLADIDTPAASGAGIDAEVFRPVNQFTGIEIAEPFVPGLARVRATGHTGIAC